MPKDVSIEESVLIDAAIDDVWRVSAHEFEHIDRWDANVRASSARGAARMGAKVGGRVCKQYSGRNTVEEFVDYDDASHTFTYAITEGLPGFVVHAHNQWTLKPIGTGKTKLTMRVEMQVKGLLGTLMAGPMKSQMGKVLRNAQGELRHYIETGSPHPRKQKKLSRR